MEVKPCNNIIADMLITAGGGGMGMFCLQSGNPYIIPAGFGFFSLVALNMYRSFSHAHIKAKPGELIDLEEVSAQYVCASCGEENTFIQKIRGLSFLQVEDIKGKASNIRTVGRIFKEQLIDLVGEDGKSVPCIIPKRYHVQEGQELTLDARLTKIKVGEVYKTGLDAYILAQA